MKTEEEKIKATEAEQRLQEMQKRYVVAGKDELGHTITEIYVKEPYYVIYEVETEDLSQSLRTNIYEDLKYIKIGDGIIGGKYEELIRKFNQIYDEVVNIKGVLYKIPNASSIKAQTAGFISLALEEGEKDSGEKRKKCEECTEKCGIQTKCAEGKLQGLFEYINGKYRYQFKERLNHLARIGLISLILITLSILTYYHCFCGIFDEIKELIFVATAGSIGGFISVSLGIQKINFFEGDESKEKDDANKEKEIGEKQKKENRKYKVGKIYFWLYGFERAFVSIFSAVIIYVALKSGLIFDIAKQINIFGFVIFGFAAGFSETFLPNVLKIVEKKGTQNK
jgi:hypothetical protein